VLKKNKNIWWVIPIILVVFIISYQTTNQEVVTTQLTYFDPTEVPKETVLGKTDNADEVSWFEVYFTSPKIPFDNKYTGGIEEILIEKIDESKNSIDVALFEFDIESVAAALIRAKDRGVTVRVVYDDEHSNPDPQIYDLINAGIPAIPDNRSAYMHNKFFIFDNKCLWTGSFNISMNAAYRNNENAIYFCSDEAARNYQQEFQEMFNGQFGAKSPADTPHPVFTIDSARVENYFAPEDQVMDKVIKNVSLATKSIHFMVFSFTHDDLGEAMLKIADDGIEVEGIFETTGASTKYSECGSLLQAGLDVRLDGNPRTFHHKVIIVDQSIVILGSFNFSDNANKSNDENLLIIFSQELAKEYEDEYQRMKAQAIIPQGDTCKK
jgi:phosphatidylserine/phosphatidylglycerophosphate/cardiolipin synthase-like enzyme